MYDNQMSVFTQQMECEPKLKECNKLRDSMKQQVQRKGFRALFFGVQGLAAAIDAARPSIYSSRFF